MAAYDIELILTRQLAECLSIPIFIVDVKGNLLFYNEPAEEILGERYEETGEMPVEEWSTAFQPYDDQGKLLTTEDLPLVKTLRNKETSQGTFWIVNKAGKKHRISVTSYPIIGRSDRYLGAVSIFWLAD